MKQIFIYIRRKLSVRLSLWVVLFAALIFNIALGFMFYQAGETVRQEAISHATQILDNTALRMESILNRAEVASDNIKWLVERHYDHPDSMMNYSRTLLEKNPEFCSSSIAFEPYYFKEYGRYFSAYSDHVGDSIRTVRGGSNHYQYFYMDWYLMLFFFIRIITRELKPLQQLANEAETIASGQFDVALPDFHRIDEIGQLTHSFGNMQQSLVAHIEELKNTTAQKASIESDIRIASNIQKGMLPENFPTKADRDDVQLYATLTPAKAVGGDLFDFYFRDEKLFFCIGDVSGKGVPASLFMAVTRSAFRTVSAQESMPDSIVTMMNKTIADMNKACLFVTLFVGELDLPTGRLYYCNAGHNAPMLVGTDVTELPCDPNIPVGFMPEWKYSLQETQLSAGTTIFLYTDGLTEAMNADGDMFEKERINEVAVRAQASEQQEPCQLISRMTDAVHQFVGDAEQSDDLTMMAIQYIWQQTD